MSDKANAVEENIRMKFTEWEFDVLCNLVMGVQFPATHVDIANKLIQKMKKKFNSLEKEI